MLVSIDSADVFFGDKQILRELSLTIEDGDRIGLIGQNGIGKSTLINLICGRITPFKGSVSTGRGITIGLLEQSSGMVSDKTIYEEMRSVFADLLKTEKKLHAMADRIAAGDNSALEEYSRLQTWFEAAGGYEIDVKINTVLNGMGFKDYDKSQPADTLSGGEKTRLALARLLLESPKLLILDEPTNHLDFETLMWLEEYLQGYKNGLLIVSHDRYFLDHTVNEIWDIENKRVIKYKGNYTKSKQLREERIARLNKEYKAQQNTIASMREYAEKNIVRASTSNMAKSRLHQLEHIEVMEKPPTEPPTPHFTFEYDRRPVQDVLSVKKLDIVAGSGADSVLLAEDVSFDIRRGEKVAVIGRNGIGKTTLLNMLVQGESEHIHFGANVKISSYEQEFKQFNSENRVLDELWGRYPLKKEFDIRSKLGQVQITGENVFKKMEVLSGGEKARVAFALLMMERGNMLILDEPTNHLDIYGKEALERALKEFDGTIIFVSHDRYFLEEIPTKIIEITKQGVNIYNGNFSAYMAQRSEKEKAAALPVQEKQITPKLQPEKGGYRSKAERAEAAKRRARVAELERLIEECDNAVEKLNSDMAVPEIAADYEKLAQICAELEEKKALQEELFAEWTELTE